MIDVAVGLALVFALTSLLTAALQEIWSSWRGMRGKFLHQAVVSFLGDDPNFAREVLNQPLIVSLAPQTKSQERRPSYMSADVIVSSLISHLVEHHTNGVRPDTPGELIGVVKAAALGFVGNVAATGGTRPNPDFARGLAGLVMGVENDWPGFEARLSAWYDAVCTRSTGWFKRDVQVTVFAFGFVAAAVININPVVIASRLWQDEPLRKAMVSVAEKASTDYSNKSKEKGTEPADAASGTAATTVATATPVPTLETPISALTPAATPALTERTSMDTAQTMVRLGEFKTALFDVFDTQPPGSISDALQDGARQFIALRSAVSRWQDATPATRVELRAGVKKLITNIGSVLPVGAEFQSLRDSHARLHEALNREVIEQPTVAAAPLALAASASRTLPAATARALLRQRECQSVTEGAARELCMRVNDLASLQKAGLPIGWSLSAYPSVFQSECKAAIEAGVPTDSSCQGVMGTLLTEAPAVGNFFLMIAGWVLTGLACTLGAPFWFDALSKLIQLRSSGGKPKEVTDKSGPAGAPAPSALTRSPSDVNTAAATPTDRDPMSDALNDAERALSQPEVERLQRVLKLTDDKVCGFFDGTTRLAIQQWQVSRGAPGTGELTAAQIQSLLGLAPGGDGDVYLG
jgi:hypothetical protein